VQDHRTLRTAAGNDPLQVAEEGNMPMMPVMKIIATNRRSLLRYPLRRMS